MKKSNLVLVSLVLLATMLPIHTNAQWYNRLYGVDSVNEMTEEQCKDALKKTKRDILISSPVTIIGLSGLAYGGYKIWEGYHYAGTSDFGSAGLVVGGVYLALLGAIFVAGGLPAWNKAVLRKAELMEALSKFPKKMAFNPFVSREFNHYSTGLSLIFTF